MSIVARNSWPLNRFFESTTGREDIINLPQEVVQVQGSGGFRYRMPAEVENLIGALMRDEGFGNTLEMHGGPVHRYTRLPEAVVLMAKVRHGRGSKPDTVELAMLDFSREWLFPLSLGAFNNKDGGEGCIVEQLTRGRFKVSGDKTSTLVRSLVIVVNRTAAKSHI